MPSRFLMLLALGQVVFSAHAEMYKCTDSAGRVTYTEVACKTAGKVVGVERASASELRSGRDQVTALSHRGDLVLKEREIRNLERDVENLKSSMNEELNALRKKKLLATNNLAGATWEASVSKEMDAVTTNYQTLILDSMRRLHMARRELMAAKNGGDPQ